MAAFGCHTNSGHRKVSPGEGYRYVKDTINKNIKHAITASA